MRRWASCITAPPLRTLSVRLLSTAKRRLDADILGRGCSVCFAVLNVRLGSADIMPGHYRHDDRRLSGTGIADDPSACAATAPVILR